MGKLYLGTDVTALAGRLAGALDESARRGDFFMPATIVAPTAQLRKWLRQWLARQFGVAINLRFLYLEELFWELLRALDGRKHPFPVERMPEDTYRLMVLSVLFDPRAGGEALDPLREYLDGAVAGRREHYRRAWQLAGHLAELIRDYEFHRREDVILPWLRNQDAYPQGGAAERRVERCQKELFRLITREPDGLRAVLSHASGKLLKTLPQYAAEVMEVPAEQLTAPSPRTIHIFGLTQISAFHQRTLAFLGQKHDVRIYHLNPLLGRWHDEPRGAGEAREALRALADRYRESGQIPWPTEQPGDELLRHFGQAGGEGLRLMADLLLPRRAFSLETVPTASAPPQSTLLSRLQDQLLGRAPTGEPLPQDTSLQIAACPGVYREVETVYQSILHNLQHDPSLRQNDIAVLATDMARYRPVVQAVFERQPRRLAFAIADHAPAGLSAFGHAVLGLLDLALESFTRSRVFNVFLNPCFVARQGVDHEQALTWLDWAEALGVYHAWDRDDKRERGYPDSGLYSWQLGLQRLRLGRLMDAAADDPEQPAPRCQDVIPFADLAAGDKEQLDAFCRAVEGLLPRLAGLRGLQTSGKAWAAELTNLLADFLTVPADRPEEQRVHDRLLRALETLPTLDQLHAGTEAPALPLSLIREFVEHNLETRQSSSGDSLTAITVASLPTLRALPFRIIYIMGLGEGLFPGTNPRSAFDLRAREPLPGDIKPTDANRFLFLEALLAARSKLYLLYPCRELQRDQELHPCGPLNQVRRHLEQHVLGGQKFQVVTMPLRGDDLRYLQPAAPHTDLLVNYNESERVLALARTRESGELRLDEGQMRALDARLETAQRGLRVGAPAVAPITEQAERRPKLPTISLRDLSGFLSCPVEAGLQRHLRLYDDEETTPADDEPFSTEFPLDFRLLSEFLHRFVVRSVRQSLDAALADWRKRFIDLHDEWRLRGWTPEDAFGTVDLARFVHRLEERIEGQNGLATFLRKRQGADFVGPVLLGEYPTPVGPRARFPALRLSLPAAAADVPTDVRLTGLVDYVWRTDASVDVLVLTNTSNRKVRDDHLSKPMFEPLLFFLALKAGTEAHPGGRPSHEWLGNRQFHLDIARDEGLASFTYRPEDITAAEASHYLTELVRDFLDCSRFDLLPFDLLAVENKDRLRQAYVLADDDPKLKRLAPNYATTFQEAVDDDQEQPGFATYRPMKLLEIVEARVPDEALAIVRRRFRLLDRGPAQTRHAAEGPNDDGA